MNFVEWTSWTVFTCSVTCGPGGGTQTATRACEDADKNEFDDSVCEEQGGSAEEERICNDVDCPSKKNTNYDKNPSAKHILNQKGSK